MRYFSFFLALSLIIGACSSINIPEDNSLPTVTATSPLAAPVGHSDKPDVVKPVERHSRKGHITLSWDPVAGASWYNLYYGTKPGVTKSSPMKVTKIRTTRHTVTGLAPGSVYFFVVTAANKNTESQESHEVSGEPKSR